MCKRHVQEIREYDGDIGHMQQTMCRRSGNIKDRVNLYKRHVQEIRENEGNKRHVQETMFRRIGSSGDIGHVQETMFRRTVKVRRDKACARDNVKVNREH
jgi:hypothetical protein